MYNTRFHFNYKYKSKNRTSFNMTMFRKIYHSYIISAFCLLLSYSVQDTSAARILLTTPQHGSHLLDKLVLGETLVARGHEVYIAVSERSPKLDDIKKRGIVPVTFFTPPGVVVSDTPEFHKMITDNVFNGTSPFALSNYASAILIRDCTNMMEDKDFMAKIKKLNFDLAISEPFILSPCSIVLPIHLNIPWIAISGFFIPWETRTPSFPSFYSLGAPYTLESIRELSFIEKLKNFAFYFLLQNVELVMQGRQNTSLIERFTPQYSKWGELVRTAQLFLYQVDHHLGGHLPALPNFISVAGLTAVPSKPLNAEFEAIMQQSGEHGVIIATFGASAYFTPESVVKIFFEAFSRLNQTVIARFGVPDGVKIPPNVKILKWLPQTDILGHPKTKLFITHCGSNGQYEALHHGVPMVGFPLFAEQHENCNRAISKGIGVCLDVLDFTADELVSKVHEVIYNDKYKKKITEMSQRWKDEKFGPRDRAAFWIEHVIKYGGRHLRSPAMELSIYEFLMLDVIAVLILVIAVLAFTIFTILRMLYRKCFRKNNGTEVSEKKLKKN